MTWRLLAVVLMLGAVPHCAQVSVTPGIPSPILLNVYEGVRVLVYHQGARCRVSVTTPTAVIESTWTRCNWIAQP